MIARTVDERIASLREQMRRVRDDLARHIDGALEPDSRALVAFSRVLEYKMRIAAARYGYVGSPWRSPDWEVEWRSALREHVEKGDPLDVAIYCMFGWYHGWSTTEVSG